MTKLELQLVELFTPVVEDQGFILWGVEFIRAGKHSTLRVYIDHNDGIDVDHCATVSYQLSAILDVEDPITHEYFLEVSSPGLERILFFAEQYQQYINQEIAVRLTLPEQNRRKFKGVLTGIETDYFILTIDGESYRLAFANVEKANVVAEFD